MHLLGFLCLFWAVLSISARHCGCPGQPAKGTVHPNKTAYNVGENVTLTCDRGYYFKKDSQFLKNAQRICQDTGFWKGTIPACVYYDVISNASITPSRMRNIIGESNGTSEKLRIAESEPHRSNDTEEITAFFKSNADHIHILVTLQKQSSVSETNMSVQIDQANQCSIPTSISKNGNWELYCICNITGKADDHTVSINFTTTSERIPVIRSFKGLVLSASDDCDEPECPANGMVTRTPHILTYYCEEGYKIRGMPQRQCVKVKGIQRQFWLGTTPECVPSYTVPTANGMLCASPMALVLTSLALIIIALTVTIFNILSYLIRYSRKKLKPTMARPQLELNGQHIYRHEAVRRVEPEVLTLRNLLIEGRNFLLDTGQSSMHEEHIYEEIEELELFSSAQTTTAEHLYKNVYKPCTGANEGGQANSTIAKIPIEEPRKRDASFIDTYGFLSSNTQNNPANAVPQSNIFLRARNLPLKSESGQLQSHGPEPSPRKANKKSDHSETDYTNVPKITSKPT